jgi:hypothetical protein
MHFNFDGLIFVIGGIYGLLVACGIVQASKNPEANEVWRKQYGTMLKILSPLIILFGLAEFWGLFK